MKKRRLAVTLLALSVSLAQAVGTGRAIRQQETHSQGKNQPKEDQDERATSWNDQPGS